MLHRSTCFRAGWLAGAAFTGAIVLGPTAGSCRIFYHVQMPVTMTVTSGIGLMSVARSAGGGSSNAVTIDSTGSTPYVLFIDQGLNATGSQRNLRGKAGIAAYKLCGDPSCAMVWASDGDQATAILVTPGGATTALPLTVVRAVNTVEDQSYSDVVTLTMYF